MAGRCGTDQKSVLQCPVFIRNQEEKMQVQNPVLRGFHPDPSLIRVGQEYYLAVSTFEWFPGVRIYHSRDMARWEYCCSPLDSLDKADLRGVDSSDGVWAPCLSYDGNYFYLIYTVTHSARKYPVMDTPNYLIRARDIHGPWSEPVYLNSSGFDPSLFHDRNGKKYLVNMEWDFRRAKDNNCFAGILLQEYDPASARMVGEPRNIFSGTKIGLTEGPHLYWHEGYYYLVCAEGGTGWFHAVTVARSRNIEGPYEVHPENPVLSSWEGSLDDKRRNKELEKYGLGSAGIQKAGHASLMESTDGTWYMAHLCGRTIPGMKCCPMGRETSLQELEWKNGWPYLKGGGRLPGVTVELLSEEDILFDPTERRVEYNFEDESFLKDFQTLRIPYELTGMTVKERKGYLRIYGRESVFSRFYQALIARRQTELCFAARTRFEFCPHSYQHCAGLIYRYDEENQLYAHITYDECEGTVVGLTSVMKGEVRLLYKAPLKMDVFELEIQVNYEKAKFFYWDQGQKIEMAEVCTMALSDDYADGFTGCFVGMCVQDLRSQEIYADFESFVYEAFTK